MIFPPPIKKGDTIGIVAPAGKIEQNIVEQAISRIEKMGYIVKTAPSIHNHYFNFSSTDENRRKDLQDFLDDQNINAILCTRGGYGTIRIIDNIDFTKFRENPKWVIGFSDITVLHAAIQQNGIASIHGPMCKSFLNYTNTSVDIDVLFSFLEGEAPEYIINPYPTNRPGTACGDIIGGNLSLLHALRGTKFDFNPEGKILFIEDLSEYLYHLDRIMFNLKLGGVLEKLNGLVVGQFTEMKDNEIPFGETIEEIIYKSVAEYDYPVAFNFPSGHIETNFPIILGDYIELKVETNQVSITSA
ncbi:S66 peptidase family protein [Plebeiibacterium marinum]|uniref:LD-carboxypeptidase n=1 Tax=Plebeiibacterium marinum TaxID=2992111 RepID=A0AAE3ME50_9BACT|nr:LD-carboxypeptidase [Plebeiobacterium marinum]MCW3806104.1 LD-carboxypeptidase [Plebeiobacterium marinum]